MAVNLSPVQFGHPDLIQMVRATLERHMLIPHCLTLEITEILLVIGFFNISHGGTDWWLHAGGWAGIVTAGVAWYTSAAGVWNGVAGKSVLPVGRPFVTESRTAATA